MIDRRALVLGVGGCGVRLALGAVPRAGKSDLFDLAERLREGDVEAAFKAAEKAMRAGYSAEEILGAVFIAGVMDVKPRHVGGKLHCVMMVHSACQLIEGLGPKDQYLAALWNLNDLKVSQGRDRRDHGDWRLSAAPKVQPMERGAAARAMRAAMDSWDEEATDQAVVNLAAASDREFTMEVLWPYGARNFASIGHHIIYTAQVDRTLGRIGWEYAVPALRSLVFGLLHTPNGRETGAWEEAKAAAGRLPEDWQAGDAAPDRSAALANHLVETDRKGAIDCLVQGAADGVGRRAAWDAITVAASRIVLSRSASRVGTSAALLAVHGLTETEAFRYVAGRTKDQDLQKRLVLQAAAWLVDVREFLRGRGLLQNPLPSFPAMRPSDRRATLQELWDEPSSAGAQRTLEARPELIPGFKHRVRLSHFRGAEEHHQPKYAAAALALSSQVAPELAPRILAPILPYLPSSLTSHTPVAKRSLETIKRAGIS